MEKKLLELCGYGYDEAALELVERIKMNYSQFEEVVMALLDLESFLEHSDYYLSLNSEWDMIKIKNDLLVGEDFVTMDSDIVVWANHHNIELEERPEHISILGFVQEE